MGIVTQYIEQRAAPTHKSDRDLASRLGGYGLSAAGVMVNPDIALTMTAVFACVRVLSEGVGSLPWITYRRDGQNKQRATDHYLYPILHDAPNPEMTSIKFREALMANANLWGNGYAEIVPDGAGRTRELWPLLSRYMDPPKRDGNGVLIYPYRDPAKGLIRYPAWRILHVAGPSLDGLNGLSPIKLARQAIGLGLAMEEFGARFFSNGAQPKAVLTHPGQMSQEAYDRLKDSWNEDHAGVQNSHKVALLEEGTTLETIGVPPDDAQFLQSRKFQLNEIARMYRVAPHLVGDLEHATFTNIEHQGLEFVIYTLAPWLVEFEQAAQLRLLLPAERATIYTEMLVDGLLRGDIQTRYAAYNSAINAGWLTRNEVRVKENLNPDDPALDNYLVPMNMAKASEMPAGRAIGQGDPLPEPVMSHNGNGRH